MDFEAMPKPEGYDKPFTDAEKRVLKTLEGLHRDPWKRMEHAEFDALTRLDAAEETHRALRLITGCLYREAKRARVEEARLRLRVGGSIEEMPAEDRRRLAMDLLRSMSPEERAAVLAEVGG